MKLQRMAGGLAVVALMACGNSADAQSNRSAWMWAGGTHPFGSNNILDDTAKQGAAVNNFLDAGFDRIYTSLGNRPITDPELIASWNARLDDAGMQSQMLLGEPTWIFPGTRPSLLNIIQTRLINFNASRTDPSELIDAVHLDIEPHGLSQWGTSTNAQRRDLLLLMGDTFDEVRALLDANGQSQVKMYADLPVWYDGSTTIGWAAGERDQWFADLGVALDGISMMAYERDSLSYIVNGVDWEVNNFNGEVRIGLEAAAIGPGRTWADFDEFMDMAEQLENHYGSSIGGIDFHALRHFADHVPFEFLTGDITGDGFVGVDDLNYLLVHWNQTVEPGNWGQGDIGFTPDGFIGVDDLNTILTRWNNGTPPSESANVPEPASLAVLGVLSVSAMLRRNR